MKPTIVHLSCDYPDPLRGNKTSAIFDLVGGTPEYRHVVYSLNRVNAFSGISSIPFGEDRIAVVYGALPKGIFWGRSLRGVSRWICEDMKKRGIKPDLVEAHKFTVEGLVGQDLSHEFSCPLVCDIQGDTDISILTKKISLRNRYRKIAKEVSLVFPYAPWNVGPFNRLVGLQPNKCQNLPVIPGINKLSSAPVIEEDRLLTVFRLDSWKRKNIIRVIQAIEKLSIHRKNLFLDIYGGGSAKTLMALNNIIKNSRLGDRVKLCGIVKSDHLAELMKKYAAFVLPSLRESYGIVYAESLISGVPVLYSKEWGIDGYFDEKSIGYACDPSSVVDIAKGIEFLLKHQKELKSKIATMQEEGSLNILRKDSILDVYRSGLQKILTTREKIEMGRNNA